MAGNANALIANSETESSFLIDPSILVPSPEDFLRASVLALWRGSHVRSKSMQRRLLISCKIDAHFAQNGPSLFARSEGAPVSRLREELRPGQAVRWE
jgi:hypothetical protein